MPQSTPQTLETPATLPPFLSLTMAEAEQAFRDAGFSPVHARAMRRSLLAGTDPRTTTAAPQRVVDFVESHYVWLGSESITRQPSSDGSEKHLVRLADGGIVETVHLPGAPGGAPSACLSSQVGCAMACRFCASGLDKVARNLAVHELLEQVVHLRRRGPVGRLVFMGAGEPTQNMRNLAVALDVFRDEAEIGPKHTLVSTVGPPSAVDRLAALGRRFTLALSLHSADAGVRAELIPTQHKTDPRALLDAADRFATATRRAYQVEYVLLGGVNDSLEDAAALGALLAGRRAHVSVIRWNTVEGMPFRSPSVEGARAFVSVLHANDVSARLRRTVGGESSAACGQLRAQAGR